MDPLLEKKSHELFEYIKLIPFGSWDTFKKVKPHLLMIIAEKDKDTLTPDEVHFKWDFLHIAALTWLAVNIAKGIFSDLQFNEISDYFEEQAAQWNPGVVQCYVDLNSFILNYQDDLSSSTSSELKNNLSFLIGTWLVWNLTNKAKITDEAEIANILGRLVYNSIEGCWDDLQS